MFLPLLNGVEYVSLVNLLFCNLTARFGDTLTVLQCLHPYIKMVILHKYVASYFYSSSAGKECYAIIHTILVALWNTKCFLKLSLFLK